LPRLLRSGARSATKPPPEANCRPTRKNPASGWGVQRRSLPRPSRRAPDREAPRCCGYPSPSGSGSRGGSHLPGAGPGRLRDRNANMLELRQTFWTSGGDVHIQNYYAALLTGWNSHVGRGPPPPPPPDRARVLSRIPVTVSCQRPLGARFAGEHGYAAPGIGKGRLEQQRSRSLLALFQPTPILQLQRHSGRHSTLKHAGTAPVGTVVATGSVPADANRDNGKANLRHALGQRTSYNRAVQRVDA
jgi:hypothetical protein